MCFFPALLKKKVSFECKPFYSEHVFGGMYLLITLCTGYNYTMTRNRNDPSNKGMMAALVVTKA